MIDDSLSFAGGLRRPHRVWPLLAGLAIIAGLSLYDGLRSPGTVVISTVVLGPFVTGLLGTTRQTIVVAVAAILVTALSAVWNDDFLDEAYLIRLTVVTAGGAIAVLVASQRASGMLAAARFGVLSAVAETADGSRTLEETMQRLCDLLVPSIADQCTFDLVISDQLQRIAVRGHGPRAAEYEQFLLSRPLPPTGIGVGSTLAAASDRSQLFQFDDELLQRSTYGPQDVAGVRNLRLRSVSVVPLRARGAVIGALTLSTTAQSGRRFGPKDAEFHAVLAGRLALALDNAGLDSELREAERQLGVALGQLDEAVVIADTGGGVAYANETALALLGVTDAGELYTGRIGDLLGRFAAFGESGEPVGLDDMPWRAIARGARAVEPVLVRAIDRVTGVERWLRLRASPIENPSPLLTTPGGGEQPLRFVVVAEDVTEFKRGELSARFLAEASAVLASSLDYEQMLQRIAEMAVPELADWCGVVLPDGRGYVRTVAVAHVDPDKVHLAREIAARYPEPEDGAVGSAAVIRGGRPLCVNHISDGLLAAAAQDAEHLELLRSLGVTSGLTVPMVTGGRVIGALSLVSAESGRSFAPDDVELAGELARRAATAVEHARLFTERSRINAALQRGLLPPDLPRIPGWSSASLYRPAGAANDVGGDFYDMFETPSGWVVIVGDVTGHGAQAARLTAVARFALRAVAELTGDPAAAILQLNRMLLAEPELSLVTIACALLGRPQPDGSAVAHILRCGHPPPLLLADGVAREVGLAGPIVGAFDDADWLSAAVTMQPGDTLLLYTDGVTDLAGAGERFGTERLQASLAAGGGAPAEVLARIGGVMAAFRHGAQRDDEALLAVRLDPVDG